MNFPVTDDSLFKKNKFWHALWIHNMYYIYDIHVLSHFLGSSTAYIVCLLCELCALLELLELPYVAMVADLWHYGVGMSEISQSGHWTTGPLDHWILDLGSWSSWTWVHKELLTVYGNLHLFNIWSSGGAPRIDSKVGHQVVSLALSHCLG